MSMIRNFFCNTKFILAVGMVVTGSVNTITTKLADMQKVQGIPSRPPHEFDHPYFQATGMFIGEMLCILAYKLMQWSAKSAVASRDDDVEKAPVALADNEPTINTTEEDPKAPKKFNPLIFLPAALCDMTGTSLMYVGLNWTYASVFQMLRGAVIIFTGILSVIFLKRKLFLFHWVGMVVVLMGLALVGLASVIGPSDDNSAPHPIQGDILVIAAQVVVAIQMVYEEKFISKYNVPALVAVGYEGCFGFVVLSILLIIFYQIPGGNPDKFENSIDAFHQLANSWVVLLAILGNIFSISFFNYFGISVTKQISATTRMVLDSIRTFVVWGFSLIVGWQEFFWLQIIGFVLLLLGTVIYNEILVIPFLMPKKDPEGTKLLDSADGSGDVVGDETPINYGYVSLPPGQGDSR